MKVLFYFSIIGGHNIEFFNHYYTYAITLQTGTFLFVLPEDERIKTILVHTPPPANVQIHYFLPTTVSQGRLKEYMSQLTFVRKLIKTYSPTDLFFEYLMQNVVTMFLLGFKKVRFHGIIYTVFIRRNKFSLIGFMQYTLFRLTPNLQNVYILNDQKAARWFKKVFMSERFKYLPDPTQQKLINSYPINGIESVIRIAHLGVLSRRKGSLELFDLIDRLTINGVVKYQFTIAGSVDEEIRPHYNQFVERHKNNILVNVIAGFVSYHDFHRIVNDSHFLILPYTKVNQSSGLVGFSALYKKPLIYPKAGLIGELCTQYLLGFPLDSMSVDNMYLFLDNLDADSAFKQYRDLNRAEEYCRINSVANFNKILFSNFNLMHS